ncbi:HPP family protein [uncultured Thiohalocapsa sp.]|uniref:HPP family protein n=1 Tax=uncultured Thiohalocapsa sp. TaxID=768990 RepID=UPI0025D5B5DF|nr:HPP family protein [uncultured Thiohalocapsa sp.]
MRFRWLGIEQHPSSHLERWLSMAGGALGIALVVALAMWLAPAGAEPLVMASMGASAVLVFAVPHGALSQPWPVLGGHLLSAAVGVSMAQWIAAPMLAGPLAVGLAILAMHYARCIHPPGGATALAAVLGGAAVRDLGYGFLLVPVLANLLALLAVGVLFNYPFPWRRYPAALVAPEPTAASEPPALDRDDLAYALRQIGSFIDVSDEDLLRIYALATRHADEQRLREADIQPGHCYSNGRFGPEWSVRCVVDAPEAPDNDLVIYRTVAGAGSSRSRRETGTISRAELARWARYEVVREETTWRPVGRAPDGGAGSAA